MGDHLEPFGAIWSHVEPFEAMWSNFFFIVMIQNYTIKCCIADPYVEPLGIFLEPFEAFWSHLNRFGYFLSCFVPFEVIWSHLE